MANYSELTRKEQVLDYLVKRKDEWVDGPEIANEVVGGSEGHKRLRELRAEGRIIEARRHPDPARDIWQYRLLDKPTVSALREPEYKPPEPKKPNLWCPVEGCGRRLSEVRSTPGLNMWAGKCYQHGMKAAVLA